MKNVSSPLPSVRCILLFPKQKCPGLINHLTMLTFLALPYKVCQFKIRGYIYLISTLSSVDVFDNRDGWMSPYLITFI